MKDSSYLRILTAICAVSVLCTAFLLIETHTTSELLGYQFDSSLYDEGQQADISGGPVEFLVDVVVSFFRF